MGSLLSTWGNRVTAGLGERSLPWTVRQAGRVSGRLEREAEARRIRGLDDASWLTWAYQEALHRSPDPVGEASWLAELAGGRPRADVLQILQTSPEARSGDTPRLASETFHGSRVTWTRSLPRARRILDLGGTSLGSRLGSLLAMGYPYSFDELIIIDLPVDERHPLYQVGENEDLVSDQGPVRYLFRSMVDLDDLEDGSFDLIVSGQTFEHITEADGATMLRHIARLLSPGGALALDTPNRAVTEIQCAETGEQWINPDHEIEYTHEQMLRLFAENGLSVLRAHGIGYMPETARTGTWQLEELVEHPGIYDAIEESYTLAYLVSTKG